jgi:hypothetical protein
MDLNAYVMAIASAPSQQISRRTVPETEFKPLPQGPACEQHSPRQIGRQGEAQNNLSKALTNP